MCSLTKDASTLTSRSPSLNYGTLTVGRPLGRPLSKFFKRSKPNESITQSINLAPKERKGEAEAPKDTTASDTHGRAAESARRMARSIITRSGGTQVAAARKGSTSAHDELIS